MLLGAEYKTVSLTCNVISIKIVLQRQIYTKRLALRISYINSNRREFASRSRLRDTIVANCLRLAEVVEFRVLLIIMSLVCMDLHLVPWNYTFTSELTATRLPVP